MSIERKLTFNNLKRNKKRTIFTTISISLCALLIFTTILLVSSIRNGITENIETSYNDYHFEIGNLTIETFNKIKDKEYIEKIYIQNKNGEEVGEDRLTDNEKINVFIKYKDIKKTCENSTEIIQIIESSKTPVNSQEEAEITEYRFNQKLLTIYGLIDIEITGENQNKICVTRVNYTYVIDLLIILILVVFSIIFIIILYNAFLITINERKREYAILNSVGGTEGQILKILFLEGFIIGIVGIIVGGLISVLCTNVILEAINKILEETGYNFSLVIEAKYIIIALLIIIANIFISSVIPSVKASATSVIQGIRNNKEIKSKKRISLLERILPIEGKVAVKNIRRVKSKYKIVTILLVICMTSYIVVSTYINYEKQTADLVDEYDSDAELIMDSTVDYETIFSDYEAKTGDSIEYIEYKELGVNVLVEPKEALVDEDNATIYEDGKVSTRMVITGVDDDTYNKYINKIGASYGDIIIYNNIRAIDFQTNSYKYYNVFNKGYDINLSIIESLQSETTEEYDGEMIYKYNIIDDESLDGNIILTEELIDGYKDMMSKYMSTFVIVNMDTFNNINENLNNYTPQNEVSSVQFIFSEQAQIRLRIKCGSILEFSNYIDEIIEYDRSKEIDRISAEYYTLENQEKIIYINIINLILKVIISAIVIIGVISIINTLNASLYERTQEFVILNSIGATKGNINKMLIYECLYMFIKAIIISIILSIPIIYAIIKYMENIISFNRLLIPIGDICIFLGIILLIALGIAIYSTRAIKNKI